MSKKHLGSNFDDFLSQEDLLEEVEAVAIKRVIAHQFQSLLERKNITKTDMAEKMHTSRAALNRLLDPDNTAITVQTLVRAASAVGKHIKISLANG